MLDLLLYADELESQLVPCGGRDPAKLLLYVVAWVPLQVG